MTPKLAAAPSTRKATKPHQPHARRRSRPTDTARKAPAHQQQPDRDGHQMRQHHRTPAGLGCVARRLRTLSVSPPCSTSSATSTCTAAYSVATMPITIDTFAVTVTKAVPFVVEGDAAMRYFRFCSNSFSTRLYSSSHESDREAVALQRIRRQFPVVLAQFDQLLRQHHRVLEEHVVVDHAVRDQQVVLQAVGVLDRRRGAVGLGVQFRRVEDVAGVLVVVLRPVHHRPQRGAGLEGAEQRS